jgi:two-component system nitrate/nitrite response regulator NarL
VTHWETSAKKAAGSGAGPAPPRRSSQEKARPRRRVRDTPNQQQETEPAVVPLRVVLADDHTLFREGLKSVLALQPSVKVVGDTAQLADLLPLLARIPCDVLLLDLQMERSALSEIPALAQKAAVIVVTASEDPEEVLAAMQAGARGVIPKRFAIDNLMQAIRAVADGNVWLPPSLQTYMTDTLRLAPRDALTPREREIVRHVGLGLHNAEVGAKLFISEQTVKTHLNNIFGKLGVRDRVELTLYAARVGIIGVREKAP